MSSGNVSVRMVSILGMWEGHGGPRQDNTLQSMFTLFLKVVLNMLTAIHCSRNLQKSFMGLSAISLFLADCLLLVGMMIIWILTDHINTEDAECFILAHASTIYSMLPLPILLLGILDHFTSHPMSAFKMLSCSMQVLAIWALTCLYSYFITNTGVSEHWYDRRYQLCTVQESFIVMYFCSGLSLVIVCILLLYYQEAFSWVKNTYEHSTSLPALFQSDLHFTYMKLRDTPEEDLASFKLEDKQARQATLLLSLILGFSANWAPFLFFTTAFWFLGFSAPSFVSVNILWLLCANSMVVGVAFRFRKEGSGLYTTDADGICDWKLYWKVSHQGSFPQNVYKISIEAKTTILLIERKQLSMLESSMRPSKDL
ncbi:putative G-protein coupled receptor 160 isoform X1 [Arapaima gigas]